MHIEIVGFKRYRLLKGIAYKDIKVPVGFSFDITIPKVVWFLVCGLMFSKVLRGVATHDYLYTTKCVSRSKADSYLKEMLIEDQVNYASALVAYLGARCIGWYFWNKAS